jgi:hypothetical protein
MSDKVDVKFIGDPRDNYSGPQVMTLWGHEFPKGEFVSVPSSVAKKAATHSHFVVKGINDSEEAGEFADARREAMSLDLDLVRGVLDKRGVEYPKNANRRALVDLLFSNGGFPTDEELGKKAE